MTPNIITAAGDLLSRYDAVFCDVWGVVHNGRKAYGEAGAALARFREQGGTVILVSNAPIPASGVERVLEKTGVRRDAWDAIVSSGDIYAITCGEPMGAPGGTNMLKICRAA